MGKYTEAELIKLTHPALCEILQNEGVDFNPENSKADLRAVILSIPEDEVEQEVEEVVEQKVKDEVESEVVVERVNSAIDNAIRARRSEVQKGIPAVGGTIEQQIAIRRAANNGTSTPGSIEEIINQRRIKA